MSDAHDVINEAARLHTIRLAGLLGRPVPLECPDCVGAFTVRAQVGPGMAVEVEVHPDTCPTHQESEPQS